tara:strand:+ start:102 stop:659 length:558 start_codon:yes stop_codon:yes gene_type:complete
MFLYKVENKKSKLQGEGLFTLEDIKKGSVVFYWGVEEEGDRVISEDVYLEKRKDLLDETFQKTAIRYVHDKFLHCTEWGLDCYMNHSYHPNILYYCGLGFAKEDIKQGDELVANFEYFLSDKDSAYFTDAETGLKVIGLEHDQCLKQQAKEIFSLFSDKMICKIDGCCEHLDFLPKNKNKEQNNA